MIREDVSLTICYLLRTPYHLLTPLTVYHCALQADKASGAHPAAPRASFLNSYIFDYEALSYSKELLKLYHKKIEERDALPRAAGAGREVRGGVCVCPCVCLGGGVWRVTRCRGPRAPGAR
jgi:hypothetical protein